MSVTETARSWAPYLNVDEEIIWTGAPLRSMRFFFRAIVRIIICISFLVPCSLLINQIWPRGTEIGVAGYFVLGLAVIIGLLFLVGLLENLRDLMRGEAGVSYALTNQRGFIGRPNTGAVNSYPIQSSAALKLELGPPDRVFFASRTIRGSVSGGLYRKRVDRRIPIGFERLEDGAEVYQILRRIRYGDEA